MVRFIKNNSAIIFVCALALFFANGCHIDFTGLFAASSDLDDRLKERDNFTFIDTYSERAPVVGNNYSFIVIADTHIKDGNAWGLERLLDVITPEIKFVVILGDITESGARSDLEVFINFAARLRSKGVPIYPVIGNHDIFFGNFAHWRELIGSTSYRIDGDVFTLFILDNANSFFGNTQLDWLDRELNNTKRDVFVFSHVNIFANDPTNIWQIVDVRERARLLSILRNRAKFMFTGHLHKSNFTHVVGNVRYVTLDEFKDWKAYCIVTVRNGGRIVDTEVDYEFKKLF